MAKENTPLNEKQQRIMQAMLELVNENGIHNTPMSQVSKRSGVSTGAIYHYYDSKEELIRALYIDVKKQLIDATLVGYDMRADIKVRFELIWRNYFGFLASNPTHYSFLEQCSISPLITTECMQEAQEYGSPIIGFLHEGMAAKQLREMDVMLMAFFLFGVIAATVRMQLMQGALSEEHITQAIQCSWDGLKYEE